MLQKHDKAINYLQYQQHFHVNIPRLKVFSVRIVFNVQQSVRKLHHTSGYVWRRCGTSRSPAGPESAHSPPQTSFRVTWRSPPHSLPGVEGLGSDVCAVEECGGPGERCETGSASAAEGNARRRRPGHPSCSASASCLTPPSSPSALRLLSMVTSDLSPPSSSSACVCSMLRLRCEWKGLLLWLWPRL